MGLFDVIFFNPPYLPSSKLISKNRKNLKLDLNWDGGQSGLEIIESFLKNAKKFMNLNDTGYIYFISSSRTNLNNLEAILEENGFKNDVIAKKHFFFEDILLNRCFSL